MLSVWYILMLNIQAMKITRCVSLKNMNSNKEGLRIIEGRDALPGEYPYVLRIESVRIKKHSTVHQSLCTCSCIKPTWSLTAAHCILGMESATLLGVNKFVLRYKPSHREVAFAKILSTFKSPNYYRSSKPFVIYNDIGILKNEYIALSSYARVSSVDYSTLYGLKISTVGFGFMLNDQGYFNTTLSLNKPVQVVDAMIIKCGGHTLPRYCLAGVCEKWTPLAPGDSGGPVIHSSSIVGINTASVFNKDRSLGYFPGYERKFYVGIITPVSPFMDWIVNVIKKNV